MPGAQLLLSTATMPQEVDLLLEALVNVKQKIQINVEVFFKNLRLKKIFEHKKNFCD